MKIAQLKSMVAQTIQSLQFINNELLARMESQEKELLELRAQLKKEVAPPVVTAPVAPIPPSKPISHPKPLATEEKKAPTPTLQQMREEAKKVLPKGKASGTKK